ncbi:MAG TPA: hypothetical protein VF587_02600 [Solirubrobacteraceae bacterium]|jgi:hypothetical protein
MRFENEERQSRLARALEEVMRPVVLALIAVLVLAAPAAADVPAGRSLLVVGQSGVDKADAVERATGVRPAGAMWYAGVYEDEAAVDGVLDEIGAAVGSHKGLVVNLGLSFGSASTPSPPYTPAVAAGAYDATLRRMAERLAALPTTVYVRPGYEFDLLGGQYGPPEVYKAAYRRVVDVFRAAGAENVRFVWHSAGAFWRAADPSLFATQSGAVAVAAREAPALPISAFYPGDGYVDAFGISYWQDSCCFGRSSQQARDEYEHHTRRILGEARAMGLPLHISESTPAYVGADSGAESVAWLDRTFDLVEDFDIRMLSLISIDWQEGGFFAAPFWNGYWPDARIHRYPDTRARFVAEMNRRRWVQRSKKITAWQSKDQRARSSTPRSTRSTRSRRTSRTRRAGSPR